MIIEFIVELLFELLVEGFVCLCDAFVPLKLRSERSRLIISVIFFVLALLLFVGLVSGVIMLVESRGKSIFGWVMVGLSAAYVISGVLIKKLPIHKKEAN